MSAWLATVPWQEIAVMILVGSAIFGLAIYFGKSSCGGCGNCTCGAEDKDRDAEAAPPETEKRS